METKDEKLSLANVKDGAILEAFDIRLQEVMENVVDPNTTDKAREITLKVTLTPEPDRQFIKLAFSCKSSLAPDRAIQTFAAISKKSGSVELRELIHHQQMPMFDNVKSFERRD